MTFGSLVRVLVRRWYLTLPLFSVAVYASFAIPPRLPVEYRTTAAVLLVGPEIKEEDVRPTAAPGARNRLLHLGDSLGTVSRSVALTLGNGSTRQRFADDGLIDDYDVSTEADSPIVEFSVSGGEPAQVEATVEMLVTSAETELRRMQAELAVPPAEEVVLRRISSDDSPRPGLQSDKRSGALFLVAGSIVAVGSVLVADAALRRLVFRRAGPRVAPARQHPPAPAQAASGVSVR
jgi:hypothetical protein